MLTKLEREHYRLATQASDNGDEHTRSDERDDKAVEIEAVHTGFAEKAHDKSADNGPDDANDDVPHQSPATFHNDGGYPSDEGTEHDPKNYSHIKNVIS